MCETKTKLNRLKQRRICTTAQITRAPNVTRCCAKAVVGFLSQGLLFMGSNQVRVLSPPPLPRRYFTNECT